MVADPSMRQPLARSPIWRIAGLAEVGRSLSDRRTMSWWLTSMVDRIRPLSYRAYIGTNFVAALMLLLFGAIGFICYAFWQRMTWTNKIVLTILDALLIPTPQDVRRIFTPYQRYKDDWERACNGPAGK